MYRLFFGGNRKKFVTSGRSSEFFWAGNRNFSQQHSLYFFSPPAIPTCFLWLIAWHRVWRCQIIYEQTLRTKGRPYPIFLCTGVCDHYIPVPISRRCNFGSLRRVILWIMGQSPCFEMGKPPTCIPENSNASLLLSIGKGKVCYRDL